MPESWDLAELDAIQRYEEARQIGRAAQRAAELLPRTDPGDPRRLPLIAPARRRPRPATTPPALRWPDATLPGPELPSAPSAAWVAQVRRLRRSGLITDAEARAYLGLPPRSIWSRLRRELRRWRVSW